MSESRTELYAKLEELWLRQMIDRIENGEARAADYETVRKVLERNGYLGSDDNEDGGAGGYAAGDLPPPPDDDDILHGE